MSVDFGSQKPPYSVYADIPDEPLTIELPTSCTKLVIKTCKDSTELYVTLNGTTPAADNGQGFIIDGGGAALQWEHGLTPFKSIKIVGPAEAAGKFSLLAE